MQPNWNRRKFVSTGLSVAGIALSARLIQTNADRKTRGCIRLLPVEGIAYSESFTRFMKRAKFDSVRDALASIRDRSLPVKVAHISAIDPAKPVAMALHSMVCPTRRTGNSWAAGTSPVTADLIRPTHLS